MTNSSIGVVSDRFDQGAINPYSWTAPTFSGPGSLGVVGTATVATTFTPVPGYGGMSIVGEIGLPALVCAANGAAQIGIQSVSAYDLTGSGLSFEFISFNASNNSVSGFFSLAMTYGQLSWEITDSNHIYVSYPASTGGTVLVGSVSSDYRFMRIRESSGTIYFDHSPDGLVWTNDVSIADSSIYPPQFDMTSLYVQMYAQGATSQNATFVTTNINYVL